MTKAEVLKIIKKAEKDGRSKLNLSDKKLKSLPEEIGNLTKLTELRLSDNQLTALPETIGNLTNLTQLYLNRNQLTELPKAIGNLTKLTALYVWENQLGSLPVTIGKLTNLIRLSAGDNQLRSLPETIGKLTNLRDLWVWGNQLPSLPEAIGNLTSLTGLDMSDNQLTALPEAIGKLTKLEKFQVDGNPLTSLPPEVREKGNKAILEYYRNLAAGKGRRYEAKLVIVGQGGVGKTCLSRALRGEKFVSQPTTHGVEVQKWSFNHPDYPRDKDKRITLHMWDFEGQQITHSTPQFFLTGRSLYLLVFNARQEVGAGRLPYWLETIRARAPECEVILVAAQCAERIPRLDYQRLKERFKEQLRADDYFRIDSGTGQGIKELKKEISRRASQLELMGHEWPQAYADVEAAVRKKEKAKKAHVTRTELYKMMSKGAIDQSEHEMLSRILGDLGTLTHFPDSMYLHDLIVLNPEWLTGAISNALEHPPLENAGGYLEHHWLTKLWSKKYRGLVGMFHRCMEEFEICYPIEGVSSRSLVPLRFRPERPEIPWEDDPDAVGRFVHYHFQFIPAGVMARFIVKTHRMGTGVFWENGVFLKKDRSQALCRLDPDDDRISIEVRSVYPQSFMEQLCGYLETILEPFEGLKYEKKLGCIGKEKAKPCTGEFPYDEVIDALTEPMSEIRCYVGKHYVNTHELVIGLTSVSREIDLLTDIDENIKRALQEQLSVKEIVYGIDSTTKKVDTRTKEIVEQIQREFVRQMNLIDEALTKTCPTLASITSVGRSRLNPVNWFSRKYRLHLYCQAEEGIHPVDQTYEFPGSREWWQKVGPHAARFLKILKMVAGPAVAALPLHLNDADWNIMKDEFKLMEEIVKVSELPGVKESLSEDIPSRHTDDPQELEGAALRALSALLQKLDPAGRWGGLQRVRTPDEKYLWLCERHLKKYKRPKASYDKPKK